MAQQYIASPGVQINEVDLSLRVSSQTGMGVLAMGFTNQGPTDEVLQVTSIEEYESVYGKPTTPAERYSYHTVKALFDSPANVIFSRLPYGESSGSIFTEDKYSALVYPIIPEDGTTTYATISADGLSADSADTFYLQKPYHLELTRSEYEYIINGEVDWTDTMGKVVDYTTFDNIGNAGLIILNTAKTTVNDVFEGHYVGISDNRNTDPGSPYKDISVINSINNTGDTSSFVTVPESRLDFTLSATSSTQDSMSEIMENIPSFNVGTSEFNDILTIGVFKLRKTPFTNSAIALSYALTESFVGSFDNQRELQNVTGGENVSIFLETLDSDSNTLKFFVNENLQSAFTLSLSGDSNPEKTFRILDEDTVAASTILSGVADIDEEYTNELFPLGVYQNQLGSDKTIGAVPAKIERVLDLVENPDLFDLDIVVEGGLGTVYASTVELSSGTYDDKLTWPSLSGLREQTSGVLTDSTTVDNYMSVFTPCATFCEKTRKDCTFMPDVIRQTLITGNNSRVLGQTYIDDDGNRVAKDFSRYIYWPIRNQYRSVNTSFADSYPNWAKVYDSASSKQAWVPISGFMASLKANMPNVWDAPAGLTRGILSNIIDLAIYPKPKERDQLYKISQNPVTFFPNEGFVSWGQKTMLSKPSAFDRINVRRAFLYLEKATMKTAKYFVFEPNNLFTRTQVINVLSPLFESVKNAGGINDYLIVCSEKNNTNEVIEQNQLQIDIYVKPQKVSEFILINFIATRQDANFEELI